MSKDNYPMQVFISTKLPDGRVISRDFPTASSEKQNRSAAVTAKWLDIEAEYSEKFDAMEPVEE